MKHCRARPRLIQGSGVNPNPGPPRRSRFVFTGLLIAIAHSLGSSGYCGSIHFDGSLGSAGALNGPDFLIPADRGKQVGGNLFHSFSGFNLIKNDVATFQGPSNVQNILARVTGGGVSSSTARFAAASPARTSFS